MRVAMYYHNEDVRLENIAKPKRGSAISSLNLGSNFTEVTTFNIGFLRCSN